VWRVVGTALALDSLKVNVRGTALKKSMETFCLITLNLAVNIMFRFAPYSSSRYLYLLQVSEIYQENSSYKVCLLTALR
jgi:hypothetical protein